MKALVVDDDSMTRMVLREVLSRYAEVHCCVDGSEAVQAYTTSLDCGAPYDLVCMDVLMPVMGGIEALRNIRREEELRGRLRQQAAKVIITTADDDNDTITLAFRELCDAYIVKPIDTGHLIDVVHCLFPIEEPSL